LIKHLKDKMEPITVIIETPKNSQVKFDHDKKLDRFKLNKILPAGMMFPFDFGYIPGTKGGDGDPLDIIAIAEFGTFTGCAMDCRIIGALLAEQKEKGAEQIRNDRFLAIPIQSELFKNVREPGHLPKGLIDQLRDFFINYNKEAKKDFKVLAIVGSKKAYSLIKSPAQKVKNSR
jgi:inorganic pyrophosphatase